MYNKITTAAALLIALLFLTGALDISAQGKGGGKSSGGGGFGGGDPSSTRGVGDPRAGTGSDRFSDPTGSRSKDPFFSDRYSDPTLSRTTKDPSFILTDRQRPFDLTASRSKVLVPTFSPNDIKRYSGIAAHLGTTPEALRKSYLTAYGTDQTLTFGNFIAANLLAENLKKQHPTITAAAILAGLAEGNSLGRTLRSLGLTADQAKAVKAAKKQIADMTKTD